MTQRPCDPIGGDADFMQFFRSTVQEATGIRITVATHHQVVSRNMMVSLYEVPPELSDLELDRDTLGEIHKRFQPIATTTKSIWSDNEAFVLHVDTRRMRKGGRYALHLVAPAQPGVREITAWLESDKGRMDGHISAFHGGLHQGGFGLLGDVLGCDPISPMQVPSAILYSPVTQCNLKCIHCISVDTRTSKHRLCPTIKAQIKDWSARGLLTQISTDYSGDILWADKRFGGELEFLKSLDVPFHVDTNGVCLDEERGAALLDSRLASLNISLDAATTATYQRVRRGAPPLEDVLANIRRFAEMRQVAGAERIELSMSFTLMRSTLNELSDFISTAASVGVRRVYARHLEAYSEAMGPDSLVFDHSGLTSALSRAAERAAETNVEFLTANLPGSYGGDGHARCDVATGSAVILGNGDVAVCCVPKMTIGNLHHSSMEEIWNGPRYREFRRRVNSDSPPQQCQSCPMMRRWDNVHSFLPFLTMKSWTAPVDWKM